MDDLNILQDILLGVLGSVFLIIWVHLAMVIDRVNRAAKIYLKEHGEEE